MPTKTARLITLIDPKMLRCLLKASRTKKVSVAEVVRQAIGEWLDRNGVR